MNDDISAAFTVNDVTAFENSGTLDLAINLDQPIDVDVVIVVSLTPDSATAGDDFDGAEDDADLMGDMEECGDMMDEGSEESRRKGKYRYDTKKADKQRGKGPRDKSAYRKPKYDDDMEESAVAEKIRESVGDKLSEKEVKSLTEAMIAIPHIGNPREEIDTTGMTDEEIELADIQRRAGMDEPTGSLF